MLFAFTAFLLVVERQEKHPNSKNPVPAITVDRRFAFCGPLCSSSPSLT